MLKLALLSLTAFLVLSSPSIAASKSAPATKCIPPSKFPDAIRIEGADLKEFRKISPGLSAEVDLVLLYTRVEPPLGIGFIHGCATVFGRAAPQPAEPAKDDSGSL